MNFASPREKRLFHRQQVPALGAIKSASRSPEPEQETDSLHKTGNEPRRQDTNRRTGEAIKPQSGRIEKAGPPTSKQQLTNRGKTQRIANGADKVVKKSLGSRMQVGSLSRRNENQDPRQRTDHRAGKSPAIESDSGAETDFDLDSDSEGDEELSPRDKKRLEQEKKQQLREALAQKRLARQATKASRSPSSSPAPPASAAASSSQPTTAQPTEPTPASPVAESITVLASSWPSFEEAEDSSESSRASRAAVRRFFKD